ncbi:uncharacterized protein LOC125655258 [Ostrea edulis]|uniref:uncharacterized protein LOC125655258 n=1 Tax=Ostrea edulis TaxID=37623 RepID=UPI0024AF8E68|nr:uncharacterized protein LOC125655258 [Ostrea edulis]
MNGIIYAVNSLLALYFVCAASPTVYTFGKSCSLHPQQINEDSSFYVTYYDINGSSEIRCSYMGFSGTHIKDKYKICTAPIIFSDSSCRMKLTLRNSLNGTALKTYACNGNPMSEICAKEGEDLYIVGELFPLSNWTRREFLFCVYVSKTYDYVGTVAGVSVGVAGSCILMLTVVFLRCRKMKPSGPSPRHRLVSFCCGHTHSSDDRYRSPETLEQTNSWASNCSQLSSENFVPSSPCSNDLFKIIPLTSRENRVTTNLGAPPPYETRADTSFNPPDYSSLYM